MDVWESVLSTTDRRRLNLIGETRWWAKYAALKKIFGPTGNQEKSLLVELLVVFETIEASSKIKPDTRSCAKAYREAFLKYELDLTAFILRAIFDQTTHLSNYLQTHNLDILKAFNLVKLTIKNLEKIREEFPKIKKQANQFIEWANAKLEERDAESIILSNFTEERMRTKKNLSGEKARDHIFENAEEKYRIKTFNNIIDNAISAMTEQFDVLNNAFYADISLLDPRNFQEIAKKGLDSPALETLTLKLQPFFTCPDSNLNAESLRHELLKLAESWDVIQSSVLEEYEVRIELRESEEEEEEEEEDEEQLLNSKAENKNKTKHESCKNCCVCTYRLLKKYNFLTGAFPKLSVAYRYILTLSFSQVACERSFSHLKNIKTRLRNSKNQDKLETFMLMAIEGDILEQLEVDNVIDELADKSSTLRKMLII
ncbi:hypothetical protein TKK_0006302 [Trichogramma kaykai]|uniref:HAT C-terminal dimerisation domain-containing protein n=1 Tax=Trichogramma kaykai TaxID=54128 RepID=A0ABD2XDG0_9HYME